MDTIFLDTSIFEANNFLEGKRIKEIYKLSEKQQIKVVIPQLTFDEIISRISKNIDESIQKFNKYRDDTRVFRNIPTLEKKFESINSDNAKKELTTRIKDKFEKSKFEILPYPTLNVGEIFDKYFNKQFPFSSGAKKDEFPDAFALKTIENWAKDNQVKVLVFAKDKDILNYENKHLTIIGDFEDYLSNKIKEIEGYRHQKLINEIDNIVQNHSFVIEKEVNDWTSYQLDDDTKYYDYSNWYDVHNIKIIDVNSKINSYNITSIAEEYIAVELKMKINYKVEIIIDDEEYMYKDDDTKEWIFLETKPVIIDENRYVNVEVVFLIDDSDDSIYDTEIESINEGRKLNI